VDFPRISMQLCRAEARRRPFLVLLVYVATAGAEEAVVLLNNGYELFLWEMNSVKSTSGLHAFAHCNSSSFKLIRLHHHSESWCVQEWTTRIRAGDVHVGNE